MSSAILPVMGRPAQISFIVAAPILALLASDAAAQSGGLIRDPESGCATSNPFPRPNESIRWSGRCRDGKLSGPGVLTWYADGQEYERDEGTFLDGELHGPATITFANGNRIYGTYRNGVRDGAFVIESPDGRFVRAVYREGAFVSEREMSADQVAAFRAAAPPRGRAETAEQGRPLTTTLRTEPPAPPRPAPAAAAPRVATVPAPTPPAPPPSSVTAPPTPTPTPTAPPPPAATAAPPRAVAAAIPAPQPRLRPVAVTPPRPAPPAPTAGSPPPFDTIVIGGDGAAPPGRVPGRIRLKPPGTGAGQRLALSGVTPAAGPRPVRPGAVPIGYGPARHEPLSPLQRPPTGQRVIVLTGTDIAGTPPAAGTSRPRITLTPPGTGAPATPGGRYDIDLRRSSIEDAAATIFGDLLARPYRVAPGVRGTISMAPGRAIDAAELLSAFRQQLRANGADLRETSDGYVIAPIGRLGG